jgi:N-acetyl-alpha-D-muramate 1-phosphate uridylyltransferase
MSGQPGTVGQMTEVAGVVLAAGAGTRLRPLTRVRPKVLCPVGGVPLVDLAIDRVRAVTDAVAVNVHHGRAALEAHLDGRVHVSVEPDEALGTAGALGRLRPWIDGRPTLVVNGDAWTDAAVGPLLDGWDGERIRVLTVGGAEVGPSMRVAGALLPWADVCDLAPEPSGLWEVSWRPAAGAGRVEAIAVGDGAAFVDCGTPAAYLAANLSASGGASVVDPTAVVEGSVERSVVWPGAVVRRGERLVDAIRVDDRMTVLVRS